MTLGVLALPPPRPVPHRISVKGGGGPAHRLRRTKEVRAARECAGAPVAAPSHGPRGACRRIRRATCVIPLTDFSRATLRHNRSRRGGPPPRGEVAGKSHCRRSQGPSSMCSEAGSTPSAEGVSEGRGTTCSCVTRTRSTRSSSSWPPAKASWTRRSDSASSRRRRRRSIVSSGSRRSSST